MNKRGLIIVIIVIGLLCLSVFIFIKLNRYFTISKLEKSETIRLNYNEEIPSIRIGGSLFDKDIILDDKDDINEIMNIINSLEIVELKMIDLEAIGSLEDDKWLYISFNGETFGFGGRVIIHTHDNQPARLFSEHYYLPNSEYPFDDERNELTQYIKSLAEGN